LIDQFEDAASVYDYALANGHAPSLGNQFFQAVDQVEYVHVALIAAS
jgi:hypothetical protein